MRVDDSRIRKEKVADSKISGYVWTGPKNTNLSLSGDFTIISKCLGNKDLVYWNTISMLTRTHILVWFFAGEGWQFQGDRCNHR